MRPPFILSFLIACATGCEKAVELPMPGNAVAMKQLEKHMHECEVCSVEEPGGYPGPICEEAFELLTKAMETDRTLWSMSPVDGYRYIGPPIDGHIWNVRKQKWEATQ